jgi:tetratricopeptide (TPR) repeat protein
MTMFEVISGGRQQSAGAMSVSLAVCIVLASTPPATAHPSLSEKEAIVGDALEKKPDDASLHLRRAELFQKRAEWDAAASEYLRAAAVGADLDQIGVGLAQVFLAAELPKTAVMYAQGVVTRHPGNAAALVVRGRARRVLGETEAAADDFRQAVTVLARPDPDLVLEAMAAQIAAGRQGDALRVADTAMHRIGTVVSIQFPAIDLEMELGHADAALARIDALLVQSPRHELWLARRGEILEEAGRVDEARETYQRTLTLIARRPAGRRNEKIVLLEQRLKTKLASEAEKEGGSL